MIGTTTHPTITSLQTLFKLQGFSANRACNQRGSRTMSNIRYRITNYLLQNPILTIGLGRIIGLILVFLYIATLGCSSNPKAVEGTSIQLGAYLPFEGNLYGVELVSYVNGLKVQASSNQSFQVVRTYTSTNEWLWGMVKTVEGSNTRVDVR